MELSPLCGRNRVSAAKPSTSHQRGQPYLSLDILLDESVPLLPRSAAPTNSNTSAAFTEDIPLVHSRRRSATTLGETLDVKRNGYHSKVLEDERYKIPSSVSNRVNVIEALQDFWQKKQSTGGLEDDGIVSYASEPTSSPPYICYVTLPGGCSFGTLRDCENRAEARRDAAHIALVNSIYNELPTRKITDSFVNDAVQEELESNSLNASTQAGIAAYHFVLDSTRGQTVLDYTSLANRLLIMHWSGTLQAMSRRSATRQDVVRSALSTPWFSEDYRSELALEWMAIERHEPGRIDAEMRTATSELEAARKNGRELAFPRLKRDVLRLAASQVTLDAT